jgi:nucleolar GTP-binding protein
MEKINQISGEFFGRASSVVKQIKNEFLFLENARKTMRGFPTIKEKFFTVAIAGFPNVGKTTLLHKLTGSKPDIASYAFTTRGINVSYFGSGDNIIQVLDTPGTLNRLDKMNYIEKQAYLAIKYCAEVIVYVFDPTEPYSLSDQEKLFDRLNETGKDIIIYISKTDLIKDLSKFKQFNFITDAEEVKKAIMGMKDV